jgi:hypothetical protein
MWTENVTWFSNEQGKKGRIQVGQLADLIVPDRDFFACRVRHRRHLGPAHRGGRQGGLRRRRLRRLRRIGPALAMPDWSPVRTFKGYGAWGVQEGAPLQSVMRNAAANCGCASNCNCTATPTPRPGAASCPWPISRASGAPWAAPAGRCDMGAFRCHRTLGAVAGPVVPVRGLSAGWQGAGFSRRCSRGEGSGPDPGRPHRSATLVLQLAGSA